MTFVELCAGSAAVATHALGNRYPILTYQGGKGKYAKRILEALGVTEPPDQVVLVDPGPWGLTWDALSDEAHRVCTVRYLEWLQKHINLEHFSRPGKPVRKGDFARDHLALQCLNWSGKAVYTTTDGGVERWVTHGFNKSSAYGIPATPRFGVVKPQLLRTAQKLREAVNFDRIESFQVSALDYAPIPGAVVYIDPPYDGTTGYGPTDLDRAAVLELAERWRDVGCTVGISEAEPLPIVGALHIEIGKRSSGALGKRTQKRPEWLTVVKP